MTTQHDDGGTDRSAALAGMIRVVLVDDHKLVRAGLQQLLERTDDVDVVAEAADGATAVEATARTRPDVVLMDLSMPGVDGIEATRRIMAGDAPPPVLVLTSFSDRNRIMGALDAGAVGYLLKDSEPEELLRGIRSAARGESPLDPRVARTMLDHRAQARPAVELTGREREVLALVGAGMANKQIARRLGITEKTVKTHLTSIFQSLNVTDRTQAALWATRNGVLD
jgi:DNA-binding NarL/FixJ family response regulator